MLPIVAFVDHAIDSLKEKEVGRKRQEMRYI